MTKQKELIFKRSQKGNHNKLQEALKILEYSLIMVEFFDIKEFNNVLAIQLRIILCDWSDGRDNSLLKKVQSDPTLYPVSNAFIKLDNKGSSFIPGDLLFDVTKPRVGLDQWLNQVIYKIQLGENHHKITIKNFIKLTANKSGGAHVDSELPEKAFIVDVHHERVLNYIARGVFMSLGRDIEKASSENLKHIYGKITKALES
ncbi:hypothetical protein HP567_006550 [Brevibacillus sp. M2.1A]|uniref:hypothetical protein n=1 Tax=Brevibacillus TaxID=55080 RepID=UPI00156AD8EB|nr:MULTISPECIES: hypothetical protein [Brevibacillus]MCC8434209.1 hypothetical protein [Brevibacillus sp. M2.1A]UKK96643.1 hypothetical protein FO446_04020 [Brevibacillus brevis]